jgi:hypothetical protein
VVKPQRLLVFAVITGLAAGWACAAGGAAPSTKSSKISSELLALAESHRAGAPSGVDDRRFRLVDDRVVIDAIAAGDVETLKSDLVALGMRNAVAFGRIVSGELPIVAIPALDTLASLTFARASAPQRRQSAG